MEDLESKVRGKYGKKSSRQIAAELGVPRTEVERILQKTSKSRIFRAKLGIGALVATLGIGAGLYTFQNRQNNDRYWVPQSVDILTEIENIDKLNETAKGMLGNPAPSFEVYSKEMEDPVFVSLYKGHQEYRQNPSPEKIGPLLSLFSTNIGHVKKSPFLFEEFQLLSLAKRVNGNYAQEKDALLKYIDTNWREIYASIQGRNFERGGYIAKDGAGFRIDYADYPESERKLLTKIIEGDLSDYQAAIKEVEGQHLQDTRLTDIIRRYVLGHQLVEITKPYIHDPQAKRLNESGHIFMETSRKMLQLHLWGTFDVGDYVPSILKRNDVVAHWHSHPEQDPKLQGLSQVDLHMDDRIGVGMVFEVIKNGMLVFDNTGDKSTLLRRYDLN